MPSPTTNPSVLAQGWGGLQKSLVLAVLGAIALLVACSPGDPVEPGETAEAEQTAGAEPIESADPETDETATDDDPNFGDEGSSDRGSSDETATPAPSPTDVPQTLEIGDDAIVEIVDLDAGEQQVDAQGNLIAIYGAARWPASFDDLPASSRQNFAFVPDLDELQLPGTTLIALDIGMCAAGIDASGFGTVELFLHEEPTEPLSTDRVMDRAVVTDQPVAEVGFEFPAAAACQRGWIPVLWDGDDGSLTARYVLTNRTSSAAEIERHVYHWDVGEPMELAPTDTDTETGAAPASEAFGPGQTITFNEGRLSGTTVIIDGWAELIGEPAPTEGTRPVAVSLTFCPGQQRLPNFGLAVDGWNLIAPDLGSDLLGATTAEERTESCFDGWLAFSVPFGAVPTGFFASDGVDAETGYAFWSLDGAALPAPEE